MLNRSDFLNLLPENYVGNVEEMDDSDDVNNYRYVNEIRDRFGSYRFRYAKRYCGDYNKAVIEDSDGPFMWVEDLKDCAMNTKNCVAKMLGDDDAEPSKTFIYEYDENEYDESSDLDDPKEKKYVFCLNCENVVDIDEYNDRHYFFCNRALINLTSHVENHVYCIYCKTYIANCKIGDHFFPDFGLAIEGSNVGVKPVCMRRRCCFEGCTAETVCRNLLKKLWRNKM